MTIKNRCDTIAKILHRRLDLNEYKDSSSHFGLSKALLKQDAAEVISAYKNVFDLIKDFVSTISECIDKRTVPGLDKVKIHFISFDKIGETCYVVLQPELEVSITLTILSDDPRKIIHSKISLEDKKPELYTINTEDKESHEYLFINESVRAAFLTYLEQVIDELE